MTTITLTDEQAAKLLQLVKNEERDYRRLAKRPGYDEVEFNKGAAGWQRIGNEIARQIVSEAK